MNKPRTPKKQPVKDWHRADIVASLRKAGWSLRQLSKLHGYASPTTLVHALSRSWPKGEQIVADAIGISPETIWPTRYEKRRAASLARESTRARKALTKKARQAAK